jgi:hypothetical protein
MAAYRRHHLQRLEREREAQRLRKEYREAELAAEPHKVCTGCKLSLPLSAYSPKGPGKFNSRCRPCHSAKVSADKRAKRAALSPAQLADKRAAERAEYYSRTGRAGESGLSLETRRAARAAAKAARQAEAERRRKAERAEANAARTVAKAARAAEAQAKRALAKAQAVARRQVELEAQEQDTAAVEIELATACIAALEAQAEAQRLAFIAAARAAAERRRQVPYVHPTLAQRLAHLWPPEQRLYPRRDGTSVTLLGMIRRHWWREQEHRIKRYSRTWH